MRFIPLLACAAVLVACAGSEKARPDSATAAPAAAAAPATLSLADLTGKWTQQVRAENSDSVPRDIGSERNVGPVGVDDHAAGKGPPTPLRVTVDGDSIMSASGPYESVLRKGVQVTTSGVLRMQDGKLVGMTTAHYAGATGADSVARLRTVMTRTP
jgi:hypothetical protein